MPRPSTPPSASPVLARQRRPTGGAVQWFSLLRLPLLVLLVAALASLPRCSAAPTVRRSLSEPDPPPTTEDPGKLAALLGASPDSSVSTGIADTSIKDDPCTPIADAQFATVEQALACYSSFALLPHIQKGQPAALKGYLQVSPYLDLFANSTGHGAFTSRVDVLAELDAIASDDSLATEFDLHHRLTSLVASLRDPHIAYRSGCFNQGTFLQPWVIAANTTPGADGRSVIYLKDSVLSGSAYFSSETAAEPDRVAALNAFWMADMDHPPRAYVGWIVEAINGVPVKDFIQAYADEHVSISKTAEARFNMALQSYYYADGAWRPFDGYLYRTNALTPSFAPSWTYSLRDPATAARANVSARWAGDFEGFRSGFYSREDYYIRCAGLVGPSADAEVPPRPGANLTDSATADAEAASLWRPPLPNLMLPPEVDWDYLEQVLQRMRVGSVGGAAYHAAGARAGTPPPRLGDDDGDDNGDGDGDGDGGYYDEELPEFSFTLGIDDDWTPGPSPEEFGELLAADRNGAFYLLDGKIGVLSTFLPAAETPRGIARWLATMVEGLEALEEADAEHLVIHVSGNGGGFQCVVPAVVQFLFNSTVPLAFDMRHTDALQQMVTKAPDYSALSVSGVGLLPADGSGAPVEPLAPGESSASAPGGNGAQSASAGPQVLPGAATSADAVFAPTALREAVRGGRAANYSARFDQVGICNEFVSQLVYIMTLERELRQSSDSRRGRARARTATGHAAVRRDAARKAGGGVGDDDGGGDGGGGDSGYDDGGGGDGYAAYDDMFFAMPDEADMREAYPRRVWDPASVSVISDGFCGSACGHLVRMLRDGHGVRAYVYGGGGRSRAGFTPSAFEGANVVPFAELLMAYRRAVQASSTDSGADEVSTEGGYDEGDGDPAPSPLSDQDESSPSAAAAAATSTPATGLPLRGFPARAAGQVALWETYSVRVAAGEGGAWPRLPAEWVPDAAERAVVAAADAGNSGNDVPLDPASPAGLARLWRAAAAAAAASRKKAAER